MLYARQACVACILSLSLFVSFPLEKHFEFALNYFFVVSQIFKTSQTPAGNVVKLKQLKKFGICWSDTHIQ